MSNIEEIIEDIRSISQSMGGLNIPTMPRKERTKYLLYKIKLILTERHKLSVENEVRLYGYDKIYGRGGVLDIRASNLQTNLFENNRKDKFVIDIEVDASDNSKSLKKLIYSKNNLKHNVLWVRHGVYRLSNENNNIIEDFDIPTIFF